jgi:hypothetical protein
VIVKNAGLNFLNIQLFIIAKKKKEIKEKERKNNATRDIDSNEQRVL